MSDPEYVAIEVAGRLTGVPARTLRRWAEAGKVPVVAGQWKRLVRLEDVRRLAAMTGHHPDAADGAGADAGQATGHVAEGDAGDTMPPDSSAVSPAARAQPETMREQWLQPLIDQLRESERIIGRLEVERDQVAQERDQLAQERDALRAELAAAQASRERDPAPVREVGGGREPASLIASLIGWLRRRLGR